LDDGSSNYQIYNNLCLNGGIKLREGFYRTVENNIKKMKESDIVVRHGSPKNGYWEIIE
jgi:hypothetical protein